MAHQTRTARSGCLNRRRRPQRAGLRLHHCNLFRLHPPASKTPAPFPPKISTFLKRAAKSAPTNAPTIMDPRGLRELVRAEKTRPARYARPPATRSATAPKGVTKIHNHSAAAARITAITSSPSTNWSNGARRPRRTSKASIFSPLKFAGRELTCERDGIARHHHRRQRRRQKQPAQRQLHFRLTNFAPKCDIAKERRPRSSLTKEMV